MSKRYIMVGMSCIIAVSVSTVASAGKEVKEIIRFESKAYAAHKEAIAIFDHRKHQKEYYNQYPQFYKSTCGECHHDKDNKKLTNLKEGDEVQNCIECHKKPVYIKGKDARGLTKKERRENHGNALHDGCKVCHKKHNKAEGLRPGDKGYAPNTCISCHDVNKEGSSPEERSGNTPRFEAATAQGAEGKTP